MVALKEIAKTVLAKIVPVQVVTVKQYLKTVITTLILVTLYKISVILIDGYGYSRHLEITCRRH